jgi:hypothetical protein
MADLIAFCENPRCGAVFAARNIFGGSGSANISLKDIGVGPCPRCGGMGRVPDGIYRYSSGALRLLTGPDVSVQKLRVVEAILREARGKTSTKAELLKKIEAASPHTASALETVPDQNGSLAWLAVVIALISLAIQIHSTYFKSDDSELQKMFMQQLLKEAQPQQQTLQPPLEKKPKPGRNKPCPCGSGRKYKKCCLHTA